jgi:hypothetical protein
VEALGDEHVLSRSEQLQPACSPGKTRGAPGRHGGGARLMHGDGDVTGEFTDPRLDNAVN